MKVVNKQLSSMLMCGNSLYVACICDAGVTEQGVRTVSGECACTVHVWCDVIVGLACLCCALGEGGGAERPSKRRRKRQNTKSTSKRR